MRDRVVARAGWALESLLRQRGHAPTEAERGREATRDWVGTRISAVQDRATILAGRHIVVHRVGSARLEPFERLAAGPGEVTVLLDHTAVSPGTERAQWLRLPDARVDLPHVPGFSGVGRVVHVGRPPAGAEPTHAIGDRVAVLRVSHTSLATTPAAWAIPVPDAVDAPSASLVYLAAIATWGLERGGPIGGARVVVIGAGTIGALAHRLALRQSPSDTTVVASSTRSADATLRAGAGRFLTPDDDELDALDADIVFEATGTVEAMRTAIRSARRGATIVQLGSPRGPARGVPVDELQRRGLRFVGAHISAMVTAARRRGRDADDVFHEVAAGYLGALADGLDVRDLAGVALDPREPTLAYRRVADGEVRHAHFDWTRLPDDERMRERSLVARPLMPWPSVRAVEAPVDATNDRSAAVGATPMRFAVVGCGDIGLSNVRAIATADGCSLTACVDVDAGLAEAAGRAFDAPWSTDIDDALDPRSVDAVVLAVPHHLHELLAQRVVAAGLHLVVEKPLAVDLESARAIVDAADAAGVALTTCFPYRYEPDVETAHRLVRAGAIGPLRGFSIVFHADKPASYWRGGFTGRSSSDWRTRPDQAGGGVLIMNLTHHLDIVRHLTGAEIATASAVSAGTIPGIEDRVSVSLTTTDGAVGTVAASASTPGAPDERFEIWGEHGTIRLSPDGAVYTERSVAGATPGTWTPFESSPRVPERARFFARFARQVHAGAEPDVSALDGLAVQAVVDAAYRSVESGQRTPVASLESIR